MRQQVGAQADALDFEVDFALAVVSRLGWVAWESFAMLLTSIGKADRHRFRERVEERMDEDLRNTRRGSGGMGMDLGLAGKQAIVCASSRGLGRACATSLAREGVSVIINGRDPESLAKSAEEIREETGGDVTPVSADLDRPEGREALVAACPQADILVNNNGGPPPGRFEDWEHEQWLAALESNLLAPAALIRALLPGMSERRFGRIVNITSAMVKTPLAPMALSTTARSGLTALCKAISKQAAPFNVTLNNLLPERFDTDRQVAMAKAASKILDIRYEEARAQQVASIAAGRLGRPGELGDACAFLCSAQAGYISGQNLQLDGGSYAGLL